MSKRGKYDDIIYLSRPKSNRQKMSAYKRAAQFAPFAALSGYEEAVNETHRITEQQIFLDEDQIAELNRKIGRINELLPDCPTVVITYFVPDSIKSGGAYITEACDIKKIDEHTKRIITKDKRYIEIEEIVAIEGEIFPDYY